MTKEELLKFANDMRSVVPFLCLDAIEELHYIINTEMESNNCCDEPVIELFEYLEKK